MRRSIAYLAIALAAVSLAIMFTGCAAPPKGYIQSYVVRTLGISIGVDPVKQTPQLYLGYVTVQYYCVPTGKADGTGKASDVPAVTSDFNVSAQLTLTTMSEQFVVGGANHSAAGKALFENPKLQLRLGKPQPNKEGDSR